jgi:hypothetical protein
MELEEDDHAKSPSRKEVQGITRHPLLGISRAQPLLLVEVSEQRVDAGKRVGTKGKRRPQLCGARLSF